MSVGLVAPLQAALAFLASLVCYGSKSFCVQPENHITGSNNEPFCGTATIMIEKPNCLGSYFAIAEASSFVWALLLNATLAVLIIRKTSNELRAYSRVMLCNCVVDTVFTTVSFLVEPVRKLGSANYFQLLVLAPRHTRRAPCYGDKRTSGWRPSPKSGSPCRVLCRHMFYDCNGCGADVVSLHHRVQVHYNTGKAAPNRETKSRASSCCEFSFVTVRRCKMP